MQESFFDKLKSWKRWMAFAAAVLPIIAEVLTGAMGWPAALQLTISALLVSMGIVAADDHSKRKAALTAKVLEKNS